MSTSTPKEFSSDLIEIDVNVYLGTTNSCNNRSLINKFKIKRIFYDKLTEIKKSIKISGIYYKKLESNAFRRDVILFYFEDSYQYISEAQKYEESILIAAEDMKSEAIILVITFLMKKFRISSSEALHKMNVKNLKPILTYEYMFQLQLWQLMDFRLDSKNRYLRKTFFRILRRHLSDQIFTKEFSRQLYDRHFDLCLTYNNSVEIIEMNDQMSDGSNEVSTYYCKACAGHLFTDIQIIKNDTSIECQHIYVEPLIFILVHIVRESFSMEMVESFIFGDIPCHRCQQIIGEFNWNTDYSCKCPLHEKLQPFLVFKIDSKKIESELKKY